MVHTQTHTFDTRLILSLLSGMAMHHTMCVAGIKLQN